jgi:hypothetical protein
MKSDVALSMAVINDPCPLYVIFSLSNISYILCISLVVRSSSREIISSSKMAESSNPGIFCVLFLVPISQLSLDHSFNYPYYTRFCKDRSLYWQGKTSKVVRRVLKTNETQPIKLLILALFCHSLLHLDSRTPPCIMPLGSGRVNSANSVIVTQREWLYYWS